MHDRYISRRQFLKMAAFSLGGIVLRPWMKQPEYQILPIEFSPVEKIGRVIGGNVEVKARPDEDSTTVKILPEDSLVNWLAEKTGSRPLWNNQRFVETSDGYIYSANLQPVRYLPNQPLTELPDPQGMWVEVTVPYVDLQLANPPARSPWLKYTSNPRLYYSQVMWADQIQKDEQGQIKYRVTDRYGSFGDFFWADAKAFRVLQADSLTPINPDAVEKLVVVDLTYQTLACLEGNSEVYFCRVSTGPKITNKSKSGGEWATPPGKHTIWRKLIAVHMTGGTSGGGYDLPGIGWTTLFASKGMAIHSTFWHNSFGIPQSHGCVNCTPEDARWVFRWTLPVVPLETGDITLSGEGSTKVLVKES